MAAPIQIRCPPMNLGIWTWAIVVPDQEMPVKGLPLIMDLITIVALFENIKLTVKGLQAVCRQARDLEKTVKELGSPRIVKESKGAMVQRPMCTYNKHGVASAIPSSIFA